MGLLPSDSSRGCGSIGRHKLSADGEVCDLGAHGKGIETQRRHFPGPPDPSCPISGLLNDGLQLYGEGSAQRVPNATAGDEACRSVGFSSFSKNRLHAWVRFVLKIRPDDWGVGSVPF
jgi:hypothetical protein